MGGLGGLESDGNDEGFGKGDGIEEGEVLD